MARNSYGTTWWGQQWLNALSGIDHQNRIPRGKSYANTDKVYNFSIDAAKGLIKARVRGNYDPFYSVKIQLNRVEGECVDKFIDAIASSPLILSKLATRQLDPQVATLADKFGINIFPKSWRDFSLKCSCPDFAVPCKHIAAVIYIVSKEIDANPFILFELHGIDILEKLKQRNFVFDEVKQSEIPSWMSFLQPSEAYACHDTKKLRELSLSAVNQFENGILKLLTDTPPGFTQGSLRDICSDVLKKAVKLSHALLSSKVDRDLVSLFKCTDKKPFIRVNSLGEYAVSPVSLCIYPSKGSGAKEIYTLCDDNTDAKSLPFYYLFSGFISTRDLENATEELESLYYIWHIALKLVGAKAVMPQMYECIDGLYRIRWIPAILNHDIKELVLNVGSSITGIGKNILKIDRTEDFVLDAYQAGLIILSVFIQSIISDAYRHQKKENDAFELEALFEGRIIDIEETPASSGIKLRLESWLQPLFIKELEVSPVIVLTDLLDKKSRQIRSDLIVKRSNLPYFANYDEREDVYDSYTEVVDDADESDAKSSLPDGIKESADIVIDIGFKTKRSDGANGFVHLKDILDDSFYDDIRFACLRTIARLESIAPNLSDVLKSTDYQSLVSIETLAALLVDALPALKLLGISMVVPKSLKHLLKPQSSLQLDVGDFDFDSASMLNLASLLSFDFNLSIGDSQISQDDFESLMASKYRVVRYKENFINVDPTELSRLKKRFEENRDNPKPIALIAAALSGEYEGSTVVLTDSMQKAIETIFKEKMTDASSTLQASLREYQKRGFSWLYKNTQASIGSIIADDMGLGKTLQVIATLDKIRECGGFDTNPALIVVPSSLLVNWQREMQKFAPKLNFKVFYGTKKSLDTNCHVVLTTYGVMTRAADKEFAKVNFRLCIIDEAQAIKNSKTANFKKIKKINADCRIAMSGTPVENRLAEYWSIMDFVNPGLLGSESDFKRDYANPIEKHRDASAVDKFRRITAPFVMRRLKSDKSIIDDLPEKISTNQYCSLSKSQAALYQSKVNSALHRLENDEVNRLALVLEMIISLKQICNCPQTFELDDKDFDPAMIDPQDSGKSESLFALLDEMIDAGQKAIIFTQFTKMGELLKYWCHKRYSMDVDFYHGGLGQKEKSRIVDTFQNDRSKKILILSLRAAGTGLNLTAATNVIHYDLWWNPAVENQATDRAYRIGQKHNVNVYRLICTNTFEEKINEIIQSKKELTELTVNAGENWIGDLSNRQLKELFSVE